MATVVAVGPRIYDRVRENFADKVAEHSISAEPGEGATVLILLHSSLRLIATFVISDHVGRIQRNCDTHQDEPFNIEQCKYSQENPDDNIYI